MTRPVDLEHQIACVRRELGLRKRTYPRWVQTGRMTQYAADHEIAAMQAVQDTLEKVRQLRPGLML